jgi:putative SOS response-associated peptidase YedK
LFAEHVQFNSITTNQAAIIGLFRVLNRYVGNLPPMPGPDYPAPVVRNSGAEREMVLLRWGMPPPPGTGGPPVTNIRNTSSPHWRMWLKPENRCLVPANSFAEYAPEPNPETKKKDVVWFALNEDRPLVASIDVAIPPRVWSRRALRACKIRIDDALGRKARC